MPIKFRCEYCRQLLGISRSRAAATVDCPQCGRSLKVPRAETVEEKRDPKSGEGAAEFEEPNAEATDRDDELLSALNQLKMLAQSESTSPADGRSSDGRRSRVVDRPSDDSGIVIQGRDVPEDVTHSSHASGSPAESHFESADSKRAKVASEDALRDLASWNETSPSSRPEPIATDLLTEMRQASHRSAWLAFTVALVLTTVISGVTGWWLGKSGQWLGEKNSGGKNGLENEGQNPVNAAEQRPNNGVGMLGQGTATKAIVVAGRVLYLDDSSQEKPDAGAAVYLLPQRREGNLKIHARSFRREPSDADRRFSEAALSALGGSRAETDEDGRFTVETSTTADFYDLIIVSQHRQRPEGILPDAQVTNILLPWFDSTIHILGQREAVIQSLQESNQNLLITVGE